MAENPHFKELLQLFDEEKVEFLIVGGYAVMKYGEPRFTKDMDIWIANSIKNAECVFRALARFGAPLVDDGITPDTFSQPELVYQLGIAPIRIDILTTISGVNFEQAWRNKVSGMIFDIPVYFISLDDLIANKQAMNRISDVEQLKQIKKVQR